MPTANLGFLLSLALALAACGSASDSSCPGCEDEPPGANEAPSVVDISPPPSSTLVASDEPVVFRFSEPMDPDSTLAAISIDPPAPLIDHQWSSDYTTLTLQYDLESASADYPDVPGAIDYTVGISLVAEDVDGLELTFAVETFFQTERFQVHQFRLTVPTGSISTSEIEFLGLLMIGDVNFIGTERRFESYLSFDISEFPHALLSAVADARIETAVGNLVGDPIGVLGGLTTTHTLFESLAVADSAQVLREIGALIPPDAQPSVGSSFSLEVTEAFREDVGDRVARENSSQYLTRFEQSPWSATEDRLWLSPEETILAVRTRLE